MNIPNKLRKPTTRFLTVIIALCIGSYGAQAQEDADSRPQRLRIAPQRPVEMASYFSEIRRTEYSITWQDSLGYYQAPNRAQNLRFTYLGNGFAAERRVLNEDAGASKGDNSWIVAILLERFGSLKKLTDFSESTLVVNGREARMETEDITIEYHNSEEGMRQNFVVHEAIDDTELVIQLLVASEGVSMKVDQDNGEVGFFDGLEEVMTYDDLNVWDANELRLNASFMAVDQNRFAIVVDITNARFPILVDPLSHYKSIAGSNSGSEFGFSVAFANLTDKSTDDIIVGAPQFDGGQTDEGKVFVFYGTNNTTAPDSTADWTAESNQANAHFGSSVANAGDVDNDGDDELLVGAPEYDNSSHTDDGSAYLWEGNGSGNLGGTNGTPSNADWSATGASDDARFGVSVAGAGHVNDDDSGTFGIQQLYADIIVGAHKFGGTETGKVFVYHGSSSGPSSSADWTSTGQAGSEYGYAVAGAGDTDNDGFDDIIVGSPTYTGGQTDEGRAYIWEGSSSGISGSAITVEEDQANARFGHSVASAGNLDSSDRIGDVIVGAPKWDHGGTSNVGKVFFYLGDSGGLDTAEFGTIRGTEANAEFGYSIAVTDLDQDSLDPNFSTTWVSDYIIGAPFDDNGFATDGGAVFAILGTFTLDVDHTTSIADGTVIHTTNNANLGASVAASMNVNWQSSTNTLSGFVAGAPGTTNGSIDIYSFSN